MAALLMTRDDYLDRVYGGWAGKCAGATLGAPFKGSTELHRLSFYDPIPGQSAAFDGLDIQLVWLHVLRENGIDPTSDDLAAAWQKHITYPWDEYGWASANLRRGLRAPMTGSFDNWFHNGLKGLARADIWAMVAPGAPQVAAAYAYNDAVIDHAGEGIWAAMFWAAIESAAFFEADPFKLIEIGASVIPSDCQVARVALIVRSAAQQRTSLLDARSRVMQAVTSENAADAPLNAGLTLIGLLYGQGDFGASLCTTVNLGYDTDTNAAALGALLGILNGKKRLPQNWIAPLGDAVVLGWGVTDLKVERTLAELAEHIVKAGEKVVAERCPDVGLVDKLPEPAAAIQATPAIIAPEGAAVSTEAGEPEARAGMAIPKDDEEVSPAPPTQEIAEPAATLGILPEPAEGAPPQPPEAAAIEATVPEAPAIADGADSTATLTERVEAQPAASLEAPALEVTAAVSPPEPSAPSVNWTDNRLVQPLLGASASTAIYHAGGFEFTVDYGDKGPVILPDVARSFTVAIRNDTKKDFTGHVHLALPEGWQVAVPGAQGQRQMLSRGGMARYGFVVKAPALARLEPKNKITIVLAPEKGTPITSELVFLGGSCWHFVGPFTNIEGDGFGKAFGPEDRPGPDEDFLARDGGLVRWQRRAFEGSVMDTESIFNGAPGVVYLRTTLHLATITEARLVAHSNDGLRIWLNNQLILQRHSHEPFRPTAGYGPAQADVSLHAGDTKLTIKVVRCSDPSRFAFMVADRAGRLVTDVGNCRW